MQREGFITEREASLAMAMEPGKARRYWSGSQHYVADIVDGRAPALMIGDMRGDVIVQTTLDLHQQKRPRRRSPGRSRPRARMCMPARPRLWPLDGTGAIRALVGGADYSKKPVQQGGRRQAPAGSAFKPFVYLAALEAGRTPQTVREDAPVRFGKWTPKTMTRNIAGR